MVNADNLQHQLWEYKEFIESIPDEWREQIQQLLEQRQEQELEQSNLYD